MSKPEDIPAEVWAAALVPLRAIEHLDLATHEWIGLHEAIARAIIAAKAEEREDIWAIASGNAVGERELERTAREANDAEGALLHALLARENEQLAASIRKRGGE